MAYVLVLGLDTWEAPSGFVPPQGRDLVPVINLWVCTSQNPSCDGTVGQAQEIVIQDYAEAIFVDGFETGDTSAWDYVSFF